jgi:transposase
LCSENTILIRFWKGIGIVRRSLFWQSDDQWDRIEPHLPTDVRGVERTDDRRVISGIVHVLKKRLSLVRLSARVWPTDDDL